MQSLGSANALKGAPVGGRGSSRPAARRVAHARRPVGAPRASAEDNEDGPQGGLRGLFASLAPKPGGPPAGGAPNLFAAFTQAAGGGRAAPRGGGKPATATVFVAGATGRLGVRIVRELAAAGFNVRAGVRSADRVEALGQALAALDGALGPLGAAASSRIKAVVCDLEDEGTIGPAIGGASRVVCAASASERDLTRDLSSPRRIDNEGTQRLIAAAAAAGVDQFVLVSSLGAGKFGLPAGVLNLFGGVLIQKRRAEEALERSGMKYLIVRPGDALASQAPARPLLPRNAAAPPAPLTHRPPTCSSVPSTPHAGGMERPKDDHKLTHNVRLQGRDTLFGGTVSRLQVAELIAAAVAAPGAAENKTVEVVAEKTAPLVEYGDLLAVERTEISQEEREAAAAARDGVAAALEAAEAEVRRRGVLLLPASGCCRILQRACVDALHAPLAAHGAPACRPFVCAQLEGAQARLEAAREEAVELQGEQFAARAAAKEVLQEQGEAVQAAERAEAQVTRCASRPCVFRASGRAVVIMRTFH